MEDKLSSFCHGIFVYLFRIYLIEKINLKLFELIILPNNQFGVDALWGERLLLLLLGLIWRLDSTFFARKDIHIIIITYFSKNTNISEKRMRRLLLKSLILQIFLDFYSWYRIASIIFMICGSICFGIFASTVTYISPVFPLLVRHFPDILNFVPGFVPALTFRESPFP